MTNDKVVIGRFGKVHGIKGWIKVNSFTQPIENILDYQPWQYDDSKRWQTVEIEGERIQGNSILVKIKGYDTPEAARELTDINIVIDREQLPELDNEFYWTDLLGMTVVTEQGAILGKVDHMLETGANDVLVVKGDQEHLLPYVTDVIKNVNLATKTITVDWEPLV